jgi:hypothetical protein
MKQLLIPAIVCILFIPLDSCMKKIEPPDPKNVTVDKETSALKGEIDSKDTINITSNDQWVVTLESGVDWLSVQPMSGSGNGMIIISTIKQNNTPARKTTNVEVKTVNGSVSRLITVTQLQYNDILLNAVFGGDGYDAFSDFTTSPDGGFIAIGTSTSTQGDGTGARGGQDIWVVKFNSEGEKVWHRKFGGSLDDVANTIVRANANHYIVLGNTLSSDGDVSAHKGDLDAWLISIDGDGNLLSEKSIGGTAGDQLYNIKSSGDGNYIMAGWTYSSDGDVSSSHGDADAWIVKVNDQGDILSEKTYGGSQEDLAYDVTPVSDGGYIFCGRLASIDGDASDRTAEAFAGWFVKLNAAGAVAGKVYLGESSYDYGTVALEANNGDYLFAGETNTPGAFDNFHGARDAFVLRLDAAGNVIWKKAFGGTQRDEPADLIETDDGNFVFAGLTMSEDGDISGLLGGEDAWVMKLNGDGEIVANTTFGGTSNDNVIKIKQIGNNSFAFAGLTDSFDDAYQQFPDGMHGWFEIINF